MKRVFIVHRWDGNPKSDWYPWLKQELENKGFKVFIPIMPDAEEPEINSWVNHLKKQVGTCDNETYFIGHSIGCQTILRYLETLSEDTKIGKIVFVAGWFNLDNLESEEAQEIASPWIETHINFNKIKKIVNKITVFLSSNEPYGFVKENERIFKEELDSKVVILKNKGHFTDKALPEILGEII